MTTKRTRISQLKGILSLQKKRSRLIDQVASLDRQIAEKLEREVSGLAAEPTSARSASKLPSQVISKAKTTPRVETRGRRGALKEQILAALDEAGAAGLTVRELAEKLDTKPANIHTWFSTNSSRISGLKKVSAGHFAVGGKAAKPAKTVKAAKATKAAPAPKAKATKAKPAAKATKTAAKTAAKGKKAEAGFVPAKRGELKENVLAELKKAGSEGISIKDLAEKVGTRYKNLYIWFVTTGKRIPGIEKVGPAQYRLAK